MLPLLVDHMVSRQEENAVIIQRHGTAQLLAWLGGVVCRGRLMSTSKLKQDAASP